MRPLALLFAILLASCGQIQTGGFETTDLQARVVRPDGTPVASARAWLVRSAGDSAPAIVLDSGISDESGLVRFTHRDESTAGLGIDARGRDSLGMAPLALVGADTAQVVLRKSHAVSVPADSRGPAMFFVPGCHFQSDIGTDGRTARLALPSGTWDVVVERGATRSTTRLTVVTDTILEPIASRVMDTTAKTNVAVLAARTQAQSLDELDLDVVNNETVSFDSLTIRLYLDGTSANMSDFAVRLDMAQLYTSAGFSSSAALDATRWRSIVPVSVDPSCPSGSTCSWAVDLPLAGTTLSSGDRLHISMLFDRHVLSGDSLQYASTPPTHSPFSGSDWSFRPRAWSDSAAPVAGLPDYAGVPTSSGTTLPAADPYVVLLRKTRLVSGNPPSFRL